MRYFLISFKRLISNKIILGLLLVQYIVLTFSIYSLRMVMEKSVWTYKITEILNYSLELNIIPLLSIWIYVYIFVILKSSFEVKFLIQKNFSRFKLYLINSLVALLFFIIQITSFFLIFYISMKLVSGIKGSFDYSKILEYIVLFSLGNLTTISIVRLVSLLNRKSYLLYIICTALFVVEQYSIQLNMLDGVLNPMIYSRAVYFQDNRPAVYVLIMLSLTLLIILTFLNGKIFLKRDFSNYLD